MILKKVANKFSLRVEKGKHIYVLLSLLSNLIIFGKLKLSKFIHGIKKPIIHYYSPFWNEARLLPFVLDYYEQFVDHFYFYDNNSNDESRLIISNHPNTSIISFGEDQFNDYSNILVKNTCWKQSRGHADYVIVCDTDEFLFHPSFLAFLQQNRKFTIFHPNGYEMYSPTFPNSHNLITSQIKKGIANDMYSKCILFNPYKVVDINYTVGAHKCAPTGYIRECFSSELKLLHYKYLSIDYVLSKYRSYRQRLSTYNKHNFYGFEYYKEDKLIRSDFEEALLKCKDIINESIDQ